MVAPTMGLKVTPPSVETSHCTVGAGLPVAAAVKVAVCPVRTVASVGCWVTDGRVSTVRAAAVVGAEPIELVKTARYWSPLSAADAVNE